jgi:hypothetical protein
MNEEQTQTLRIAGHTVVIAYDPDACVWYVQSSTVPGLIGEGTSPVAPAEELQVTLRSLAIS